MSQPTDPIDALLSPSGGPARAGTPAALKMALAAVLGGAGLIVLMLAVWFAVDGFHTYPQHNVHVQEFRRIREGQYLSPVERESAIRRYEQAHGVEENDYQYPKSKFDFISQYICLAITAPMGLMLWLGSGLCIYSARR